MNTKERKRISNDSYGNIFDKYRENNAVQLSLQQYVVKNFDDLRNIVESKGTIVALWRYLKSCDIDVGTYDYFRGIYNSVNRGVEARQNHEKSSPGVLPKQGTQTEKTPFADSLTEKTAPTDLPEKRRKNKSLTVPAKTEEIKKAPIETGAIEKKMPDPISPVAVKETPESKKPRKVDIILDNGEKRILNLETGGTEFDFDSKREAERLAKSKAKREAEKALEEQ